MGPILNWCQCYLLNPKLSPGTQAFAQAPAVTLRVPVTHRAGRALVWPRVTCPLQLPWGEISVPLEIHQSQCTATKRLASKNRYFSNTKQNKSPTHQCLIKKRPHSVEDRAPENKSDLPHFAALNWHCPGYISSSAFPLQHFSQIQMCL